ncbi:hypothetical protein QMK19_34525 [Streptomyces sp. H10-C2]|uniref:hypothetical protein n=1 Tax=unclassified Streptomyces TaxID=2593676 RepID=UPI0024BB5089|nr:MULTISPECIES: hypothetical protein [unclassified Streptomyces]MDJ0346695.1 hypothetical protein [Streptomyces sp. PH10-H1]MDJ0374603.1 hypothetical protein [Streptomyces sp. H10-C2]
MKKFTAVSAIGLSIASLLVLAPNASASGDGHCNEGKDACFHYNSGGVGAFVDIDDCWGYNHANFTFIGPGAGAGLSLKNNAASVTNWTHSNPHYVYYYSDRQGPVQIIGPWVTANLNGTLKNQNASSIFYESGNC